MVQFFAPLCRKVNNCDALQLEPLDIVIVRFNYKVHAKFEVRQPTRS